MISAAVDVQISVGASGLLAFWLVVRCRSFGPQTLRSSLVACAIAFGLLKIVERTTPVVADASNSAVALLCVVVPAFGFAFWSCGVLMRAFSAAVAGLRG